jgi:hypothetical protein
VKRVQTFFPLKKRINDMAVLDKISKAQKVKIGNLSCPNIARIKDEAIIHNFHFIPASLSFQIL